MSKYQNVKSPGTGLSYSTSRLVYPRMKKLNTILKITAPQDVYRISDRFYYTSLIGQQGAHNLWNWTANGITGANDGLLTHEHITDLMARCVRTDSGSEAYLGLKTGAQDRQIWLDKLHVKTLYTNCGQGTVVMYLFDCIAKDAKATIPRTDWDLGIDMAEGNAAWADATNAGAFGSMPTENTYFNKMWKIIKTVRVEIHSGGSHQHEFTFSYNGLLPLIEQQAGISNTARHKGVTVNQLMIMHGMPVDNTNAFAAIGTSEVSIDQAKIVGVTTHTAYARIVTRKPTKYYATNGLPTSGTMVNAFIQSEKAQTVLNSFAPTNWG